MRINRWRAALAFLALAAFLKELVFIALVPLWQGPDEPVHFSYLQFIAEEKAIPVYRLPFETYVTDFSPELTQSMAAMDKDHVSFHPDNIQRFLYEEGTVWPSPALARKVNANAYRNAAAGYSPLYYAYGAAFYTLSYSGTVEERAFAVRVGTALLIIPFVLFSFGFGRVLLGSRSAAIALAAFAAFQPQLSFVYAIANNDAMLITCSAGAAYFMALWLARGGLRPALLGGLFAGLAALAKPHGLFLLPAWLAFAAARSLTHKRMEWKEPLASLGLMAAIALPWYLFCAVEYGHPLGPSYIALGEIAGKYPPHSIISTLTPLFFRWPYTMFVSYWGNFGHLDTPIPDGLALALWWIYCAIFVALWATAVIALRRFSRGRHLLFLSALCAVIILDLMFAFFFYHSIMYEGGQGRYYFPAWLFMSGAVFYSVKVLVPGKFRRACYLLLAGSMILFCVYSAYAVLMPRYYL
ncbi:MAG: DUF2142 domain-containing protein [Nitrospinae bacterium]|nr:DUF2142 domain-containing protein [Nitrospinota bacterium]